jgi:signal transduction histidine kinase/ligand-binding sensor domain-containing protein
MRLLTRTLCFCFAIALTRAELRAQPSDRAMGQFVHTAWSTKEGAPSELRALAQTKDGFLWLGTRMGLYRFDGVRFEPYAPQSGSAFPSKAASSLLALDDGSLVIGFENFICLLRDGKNTTYGVKEGVPGHVHNFIQDHRGTLWAATSGGLARLNGERWEVPQNLGYPGKVAQIMSQDHQGTIWVATENTVVYLPLGSRTFMPTGEHIGRVMSISEGPDGGMWMAEIGRSVRRIMMEGNPRGFKETEILVGSQAIYFDHDGSLWITSLGDGMRRASFLNQIEGQRIGEFSDAIESFTTKDGLTSDAITCILADREGNIWVGTTMGLDRFRKGALAPIVFPTQYPAVSLAAGDDAEVWGAVVGHGLLHIRHDTWKIDGPAFSPSNAYRDAEGAIWWTGSDKIVRLKAGKFSQIKPSPPGSWGGWSLLVRDLGGMLWLNLPGKGIFYLRGKAWKKFALPPEIDSLQPLTAFVDPKGIVWFGYEVGTVVEINGDNYRIFSPDPGSMLGSVRAISGTAAHLWFGGEHGLVFFDGSRFHPIAPASGQAFGGVSGIVETVKGDLWFAEYRGVIRIPAGELSKVIASPSYLVKFETFNSLDGLPSAILEGMPFPTEIQATDGKLWFAATNSVVWIDPEHIPKNTVSPPVSILSINADGKVYRSLQNLVLPVLTSNLQIAYTALSLSIPERVHFKYKLDGVDKDWQDAETRREAFYTKMGPGHYIFHVIACNNDGIWNDVGASFPFSITPAYYQTVWFKLASVLLALVAVWMLFRLRLRQATEAVRGRLAAQVAERERIARELHDTFLQGLYAVLLRFQTIADQVTENPPVQRMMADALNRADAVLVQGRESLRDLRGDSSSMTTVAEELECFAQGCKIDSEARFNLVNAGETHAFHPVIRDEIIQIGKEAILNAFRHSEASDIHVELCYERTFFSLTVRDDGRGIDPSILAAGGRTGHWGMLGMRERCRKIGAQFSISSPVPGGTEVKLRIPSTLAYASAAHFGFWNKWLIQRQRKANVSSEA